MDLRYTPSQIPKLFIYYILPFPHCDIIVPVSDMQHISRAKIIDNQIFSVSDHHPVFFTVAIKPLMTSSAGNAPLSGAWDRAREYDYSFVYPRYCGMWSFQMVLSINL
jgi:hypothetical protein